VRANATRPTGANVDRLAVTSGHVTSNLQTETEELSGSGAVTCVFCLVLSQANGLCCLLRSLTLK
jgi:hypothetical protein